MDGSQVGRGCMALVVSVVYQKRALPLCWMVITGKKGHFSEENHVKLLQKVASLVPPDRQVIFLGDGEFDGCVLLGSLRSLGGEFACRTAKNLVLLEEDAPFGFEDLCVQPGELLSIPDALFTEQRFGPVTVIASWEAEYKEPLFLVTNLELAEDALYWYRRRFRIETFFSDQKSRGFYLCHSHLSDPARLSRLLIAGCLAYLWLVYLGAHVQRDASRMRQVHRRDRCDLSLFQLGLAWLEHCINEGGEILVACIMPRARTA